MTELLLDEQDQIRQRREKLTALREETIAFPTDFRRDVVVGELIAKYSEKSKDELESKHGRVKIAGRMMTRRIMGKASFSHCKICLGKCRFMYLGIIYLKMFITTNSKNGILVIF